MKILALCWSCAHKHVLDFDPDIGPGAGFGNWLMKHPQHDVDFWWPERSAKRSQLYTAYGHLLSNNDIKLAYAATISVTITLASLAASSTLLAGRESTAIDNGASNKYLDYLLAGNYRTAATLLQAGTIRTAVVGARDDTPTWPDVFDGTDSVETVTTADIFNSICFLASDIATDATQRTWPFGPVSVESLFGKIPDQFVIFVTHTAQTAANVWSATESDHAVKLTPVYATVI